MIYVIGLGFVGLTTAIGLAFKGNDVIGIDKNLEIIKKLNNNKIPFYEPNLENILVKVKKKKLILQNKISLENKDNYFFICVGTPSKISGAIDLRLIIDAVNFIINLIKIKKITSKNFIIIKSTVIPGTIELLEKKFKMFSNIFFASNPEFLREGFAWNDFIYPDKIVIGAKDYFVKKKISKIFGNFKTKKILLESKSSEFLKYFSNIALANMISYSNEMLMLAEKNKINEIKKIFSAFHMDKRWIGKPANMSKYYYPGIGFGGYCLPKDLRALVAYSNKNKNKNNILNSILITNKKIFEYQIKKIVKNVKKKSKIYLLGMSFKPLSDDLRDSVSIQIAKKLLNLGYKNLIFCDPMCKNKLKRFFKSKKILSHPKIEKNSIYILLTAWPEYLKFIKKNKDLKIIDLRYTN